MAKFTRALITGGSSGIGEALARRLARDGVEVVPCARREDELARVCEEITRAGGRATPLRADVTDPDALVSAIRAMDERLGGFDLVIANAGIGRPQDAKTLSWAKAAPLCATNFTGAVATLTAVLPDMVARGRGHLAVISSVAALGPTPGGSVYRATKAGVSALVDNLRAELGGTGVSATAVHPGFVLTPMAEHFSVRPPGILSPEQAADVIVRGLGRNAGSVDFPFPVVASVRLMDALPRALSGWILRRMRFGELE